MATKKQIADLHAKLTADVRQYVQEMTRASRVTRDTERQISGSMRGAANSTQAFNAINGRYDRVVSSNSKRTNIYGARLQQAGYQVQDFAVQVAAGQGALRAFGQQAPQFLGVFGAGGAIAGAALAVGALVTQFVLGRNAAKDAAKEVDAYTQAVRNLRDAIKEARFSNLSPLGKKEDLEKQIATTKKQIAELFKYTNAFELAEERKRLGKQRAFLYRDQQDAIARGGSPDTNASAIAALESQIAEINAKGGEDNIKANLTRIAELGKELVKLKQDLSSVSKSIADDEARASTQRIEALRQQAEQIINRNQSAVERFNQKMKELRAVFFSGVTDLTRAQYEGEARRLRAELDAAGRPKSPVDEPLSDRFTRIGLLSGPNQFSRESDALNEQKKQTGLLENIRQLLQKQELKPLELAPASGFWIT